MKGTCKVCGKKLPPDNPDDYCSSCYPYDLACDVYKQHLERTGFKSFRESHQEHLDEVEWKKYELPHYGEHQSGGF